MRRWFSCMLGALFCLALVGSCADDDFDPGTEDKTRDEDGDGYTRDIDCDDKDDSVFPGAEERENCLDDDCDGKIDETTSNEDLDGDGYCPSTGDAGDCEGNASRNPGAAEDGGDGSKKGNGIDDNCNGVVDEGLPESDIDGDGFTFLEGDCNDRDPYLNPGAVEVAGMACREVADCPLGRCYDGYCRCTEDTDCASGDPCAEDADCKFPGETCKNKICVTSYFCLEAQEGMPNEALKVCRDNTDNDCDGETDEFPGGCDALAEMDKTDPYDYARAIELCDTSVECGIESECPGELRCIESHCTRVLSASFNSNVNPNARAIAGLFAKEGPFKPQKGESFAILSTGHADYDPAETCPQDGTDFFVEGTDPDPQSLDPLAYDVVELALEILVPTNAQSFEFDFQFFSTEYPEYVGSEYNDTFWVKLDSQKYKGNISYDKNGTPIRINNAFFDICDPYPELPETQQMCSKPASGLLGTGYARDCHQGFQGNFTVSNGGSTGWLHTTSPVTPGEKIKLTFSIFDKGDGVLDSAVLIDNFQWKLQPATEPMTGPD